VAVAVAVASLAAYLAVRERLRDDVDASLRDRVEEVRRPGPPGDRRFPPPQPAERGGEPTAVAQYVFADGTTMAPREGGIALEVDDRALRVAAGTAPAYLSDVEVSGRHLRVLTAPAGSGLAVQVVRPLDEVDSLLGGLRVVLLIVAGAGVVTGAALGWLISGRALRPVRAFTDRTEAIAGAPDITLRLAEGGEDELGRLARSFNTTLDGLERSVEAQRQLVADASHELRTPLASLRTNIEVLQRGDGLPVGDRDDLLRDLVAQTDELTNLVGDVVDAARRGESTEGFQDVRLDELVQSVVARTRRLAPQVELLQALEPWVVRGEPERLARLVANLLDNAVKWSPTGGRVEVRLAAGELSVRDHGPGIAPDDLPLVFDRFYRASSARSLPGSGLGLAIVRQVAQAHGAVATAENADGSGAIFRVRFPAAE
jgi:two-component system sensor histidine kinase MprB